MIDYTGERRKQYFTGRQCLMFKLRDSGINDSLPSCDFFLCQRVLFSLSCLVCPFWFFEIIGTEISH